MSFSQEFWSWFSNPQPPRGITLGSPPNLGDKAPSSEKLLLPDPQGKPVILAFLRHCGCPFAEQTFRALRAGAAANKNIHFIAISHSSTSATEKWVKDVGGSRENNSAPAVDVIVDEQCEIYTQWGLGATSLAHVLNPSALYAVYALGREKGIWNKPTESGSRWQRSGAWAVDEKGVVIWGHAAERADDTIDVEEAVKALER